MFPWHSKKYKDLTIDEEKKQILKKHSQEYNIPITDYALWNLALTHISCTNNNVESYERLEFLGDSILGLCLADVLFSDYTEFSEGKMSMIKSNLVNEKTLSKIAGRLKLLPIINLGHGEKLRDERAQEKVLCDVFESTVAVIFLQHGFKRCRDFIKEIFDPLIQESCNDSLRDAKTFLQKVTIKVYKEYPKYEVIDMEGPDHGRIFTVKVVIDSFESIAKGRSKKEAEQNAAQLVLTKMLEYTAENPDGALAKEISQID